MAAIHQLSMPTALPEFDLFTVPPTQVSVSDSIVTEHRPIATLSSSSFIEFFIPSAADEYILFYESYLYLKCRTKLSKTEKGPLKKEDWDKVIPAKYLLHAMFKQVEISLEGKDINLSPQTYGYNAYFKALFGHNITAQNTHLSAAMLHDRGTSGNALIKPDGTDFSTGCDFELMGKLQSDLTYQSKAILGGCGIKIKLVPQSPEFYFQAEKDFYPTMEFLDATFFVHRLKVTTPLYTAHAKALNIGTCKYSFTRTNVKPITIPKDSSDALLDNVELGQLPRRIFIGMVSNKAFNGSYAHDPFFFQNFNVNYITVFIDGIQFPSKAYQPNFKKKLFMREYVGLFQALDENSTDTKLQITRDEFQNGKTLFGFNFAPDLSHGCGQSGHLNPIKRGALRIHIRFENPLSEAITVVVYCEYDNLIEIDSEKKVLTDFN